MKKILIIGGIAATTVLFAGWAVAQSGGPGGFGPPFMHGQGSGGFGPPFMQGGGSGGWGPGGMMGMRGHMGFGMRGGPGFTQIDPARLDALKSALAITTAQQAVWTKYAKAIEDSEAAMKKAAASVDAEAFSKMTPQDRFAFMSKMREQGQKQFETVLSAAKELLAALDDTQKVKAQETLPGLAFGPGMMHSAGVGGPPFRR